MFVYSSSKYMGYCACLLFQYCCLPECWIQASCTGAAGTQLFTPCRFVPPNAPTRKLMQPLLALAGALCCSLNNRFTLCSSPMGLKDHTEISVHCNSKLLTLNPQWISQYSLSMNLAVFCIWKMFIMFRTPLLGPSNREEAAFLFNDTAPIRFIRITTESAWDLIRMTVSVMRVNIRCFSDRWLVSWTYINQVG